MLLVQNLKQNGYDCGHQQRGKKLSSGTSVQVCDPEFRRFAPRRGKRNQSLIAVMELITKI